MLLSIVILTYNSEKIIRPCLDAIIEECIDLDYEILIIDNGSEDDTIKIINNSYPSCLLIKNSQNLGVAKARNIGIRKSNGDYILIVDDDVIVHPYSISKLLQKLNLNKDVGIIAPQLENPDGTLQYNGLPLPTFKNKSLRIVYKLLGLSISNPYGKSIGKALDYHPDYLIGAIQLIRKEVFDVIGLLDENIFYGPEDADFCLRAKRAGFDVLCSPNIRVTHAYQRRSYKIKQFPILIKHFRALVYFWIKMAKLKPM